MLEDRYKLISNTDTFDFSQISEMDEENWMKLNIQSVYELWGYL